MSPDVLMYTTIGGSFTGETARTQMLGGSELEMVQIAESLAARGHEVVIANGVELPCIHYGVRYVPNHRAGDFIPRKALYIQRMSEWKWMVPSVRLVVRVTDLCAYPEPFSQWWSVHKAAAVCVSRWQADKFTQATERIVINPMLDPTPETDRIPGRFVYASGPSKGLAETLAMWRKLHAEYPKEMAGTELLVVNPWPDAASPLTTHAADWGVRFYRTPNVAEYRRVIASAEALFYVNVQTEAFCCVAALAERSGTRPHILCKSEIGGIIDAVASHATDVLITKRDDYFAFAILEALGTPPYYPVHIPDRSRSALVPRWEEALHL
jgi:hypothetical protein